MSLIRRGSARIAVACAVLGCGITSGQDASATRNLKVEGVGLTLPHGWEWQAPAGSTIAIKQPVKVGERNDEMVAELFFAERRFINDRLQELQSMARDNPVDHKEFKVDDNQTFPGSKEVAMVSYIKERGSDPPRLYHRRHFLIRRYGHLYEWREESPKDASRASSAFSAARSAIKWSKPESPAVLETDRDYVEQQVRFKLPEDWNWHDGKPGPKVQLQATGTSTVLFFIAVTDMIFKEGRGRIQVVLQGIKSTNTVIQFVEHNKKTFQEIARDPQDFLIEEKVPFRGEKSIRISFTGCIKAREGATAEENKVRLEDKTRYQYRLFVFKHRGHIFMWMEVTPTGREQQAAKIFETVRKGLTTY